MLNAFDHTNIYISQQIFWIGTLLIYVLKLCTVKNRWHKSNVKMYNWQYIVCQYTDLCKTNLSILLNKLYKKIILDNKINWHVITISIKNYTEPFDWQYYISLETSHIYICFKKMPKYSTYKPDPIFTIRTG